jgi:hypothetical protein
MMASRLLVAFRAGGATLGALTGFSLGWLACLWLGATEKMFILAAALSAAAACAALELWLVSIMQNPSNRRWGSRLQALMFTLTVAAVFLSLKAMHLI